VFDDKFEMCLQILSGEVPDNGTLPCIWRLDKDEEVNDKRMWHKANPSLRYFPNLQTEIELEYQTYAMNPAANPSFMAKRMNRPPVQMENEVTSWDNLLAASRDYALDLLRNRLCVAGIDYASTTDFVAAGLLFRIDEIDYWYEHTWVCSKSAELPRIKAPLRDWAALGYMTFVDAAEIPPDLVAIWLQNTAAAFNAPIITIGIDQYRYTLLSKSLRECIGFSAEKEYGNVRLLRGSDEMKTIPSITAKFAGHRIIWGDRPDMRWFANNSKIDMTKFGNMTYQKIEPKSRKTDGFKAFAAAECVSDALDGGTFNISDFGTILTF
jgi:phage terminase large subunit-like protein